MAQQKLLPRIRPGNVMVNNRSIPMNPRQEVISNAGVLQPYHAIPVTVKRFFTDTNGTIIPKTDPGLIAAGMAQRYPVFLLGQWDKEGGYKIGLNVRPPIGSIKYLMTFVNGYGMTSHQIVTPYSPFNTIQQQFSVGDLIHVFVDNIVTPNYFCFMVQNDYMAGINSILSNLSSSQKDMRLNKLFCYEINFRTDFVNQLDQQWDYVNVDNIGTFKENQVTYNMFRNPFNVLPDVLVFSTKFFLTQYIGIYMYMNLAVDEMSFNFNLKFVDPNTTKSDIQQS